TGGTNNTYYDSGLLKTSQDARGHVTTYTYDALDRPKTITPDSGTATTFFYDGGAYGKGRLTSMSDESGTSGFGYDAFGAMTSRTQTTGPAGAQKTFASSYLQGSTGSATGKLQTLIYPSHASVGYGYDAAGRINSISVLSADGVTVTKVLSGVQYNALGQPVSWIWSVGNVQYQRSYDAYGRLVSYPLGNPGGSGISAGVTRTIAYDAAGRIVGYSHTTPVNWDQVFGYDGLDRLTGASLQSGNVYSYAYDATGNRTQTSINGTAYADTVSATSNRYSSVSNATGTASQGYDAAGNLTSDAAGTYTYSARGRMSMQTNAGGTFTYLYNGLGQRVYKSGPSSVITTGVAFYAYDPQGRLLGEYDANGKAVYETVYLGDTPVAVLTQPALNQTTVSYAYSDHLNTARVLVRPADQAIVWSWGSSEPFGQSLANSNPSNLGSFVYNPRFPGQVADAESGWFYNWHRDYDPSQGRYKQSDPIGLDAGSMSTYAYVDGDPIRYFDSNGEVRQGGKTGQWWEYTDRNFQRWFHQCWKSPGDQDATRGELGQAYAEWLQHGKPDGKNGCGGPPPPPPAPASSPEGCDTCKKAATTVVVGGTSYVIYRCLRMLPSLLPPLWETIPINAAAP
ncbi:MAG: RHS repeat-associated core domain-containing protein, partial [Burkholderiaceae bacterium]